MERKIGETFEYDGKTLQVKEIEEHTCKGCFFGDGCDTELHIGVTGECLDRTDGKEVIYVEVPEQPAPQEEQKLNLCEKLKYCPEGTQFWSPLLGDVKFICLGKSTIPVEDKNGRSWDINPDSTMTIDGITSVEPMLFPSREQRDWSKVKFERPVEKLPKTWDEFVTEMGFNPENFTVDGLYMEVSDCMLAGGDDIGRYCDQHIAMVQLHALRDCYRQGWKPEHNKACWNIILFKDGELQIHEFEQISSFLSFGNQKTARAFLNRFEDLIKEAGDLI